MPHILLAIITACLLAGCPTATGTQAPQPAPTVSIR